MIIWWMIQEEEDPSRMPRGWMFQAENLVSLIPPLLRDGFTRAQATFSFCASVETAEFIFISFLYEKL